MVNLADLIKVIVFIVAVISVTIISNCILKQGNDKFLCAVRGLLGGPPPGLHVALPYPLPLASEGKEHSGLQLLCHAFSLEDRVAGGLFLVSSRGGSYLTLLFYPLLPINQGGNHT